VRFVVTSAGPVVYLDCSSPLIMTPADPILPGSANYLAIPWVELYPRYGRQLGRINSMSDNGDGELSICDVVVIGRATCHVKRVGCDLRVIESPNTSEVGTWGRVKGLFRSLRD
jgi:hypothetical protein